MSRNPWTRRAAATAAVACLLLPGVARAQPAEQEAPPTATSAGEDDVRDRQIQELRALLDAAVKRIDALERALAARERPPQPPEPPAPPAPTSSSATLNPNISAIGNLIFRGGDRRSIEHRGQVNFDEIEVSIQDRITPRVRYDLFFAAAKEGDWEVGLEEGFVTAGALLKGLGARAGRIRTPFGKFNPLHPHLWPFVSQPLAIGNLVGAEGLVSDGAVLEYLLPIRGLFARAEVGRWETTSEAEDGLGFGAGGAGAWSGRLWLGKDLGRDRELELGVSRYQGDGRVKGLGRRRQALNGLDLTYRAHSGRDRRTQLALELIGHQTSHARGDATRLGAFLTAIRRWNRYWEAGVRGDYSKYPFPLRGSEWAGTAFLTRYLNEQTSLRVEYQYANGTLTGSGSGIFLQLLFGSGPHSHLLR